MLVLVCANRSQASLLVLLTERVPQDYFPRTYSKPGPVSVVCTSMLSISRSHIAALPLNPGEGTISRCRIPLLVLAKCALFTHLLRPIFPYNYRRECRPTSRGPHGVTVRWSKPKLSQSTVQPQILIIGRSVISRQSRWTGSILVY